MNGVGTENFNVLNQRWTTNWLIQTEKDYNVGNQLPQEYTDKQTNWTTNSDKWRTEEQGKLTGQTVWETLRGTFPWLAVFSGMNCETRRSWESFSRKFASDADPMSCGQKGKKKKQIKRKSTKASHTIGLDYVSHWTQLFFQRKTGFCVFSELSLKIIFSVNWNSRNPSQKVLTRWRERLLPRSQGPSRLSN